MSTDAIRKARARKIKKGLNLVERRLWLTPDTAAALDRIALDENTTRAGVIALLLSR